MRLVTFGLLFLFFYFGGQIKLKAQEDIKKPTIKVGVYDNPPKISLNENNNPEGIFIDIIEFIAKNENLQIEYISGDWTQLISMLNNGEIDVLPDVAFSKERDSLFSLSSIPLLNSWIEIFTRMGTDINSIRDLQNKKIGVLEGSNQYECLINILNEDSTLTFKVITYNDYSSSVRSLKDLEIDAIAANRFFYFSDLCDKEIFSTGEILQISDLYFAFPKNKNPDLVKLFDKNILLLQNNPKSAYYKSLQHWLDKDDKASIPRFIVLLIIVIIFVLIFVSAFAFMLKARVKAKTMMLQLRNDELIIAKERAEESDRLKLAFLANMSHEIRTPMNGILGFTELLLEPDLASENKEKYINIVHQSGQRMLNTVNDIVEISKIEAGIIILNLTPVNIQERLDELIGFFTPEATQKGLNLILDNESPKTAMFITTDQNKLDSILTNLIKNAIKYTLAGEIRVGFMAKGSRLEFYVKDTGIGIPAERHKAVFERFIKADIADKDAGQGSGLGLAITKAYVEMLGGEIRVESKVGEGSSFFFTLPLDGQSQEKTEGKESGNRV